MFLIKIKTWCGSLTQPSEMFDHSSCQVLDVNIWWGIKRLLHLIMICKWCKAHGWGWACVPKYGPPQTYVYNLSPYGIFLRACSSLNYPPGSQSWVSNCPIKLLLKVLWQVQQCRSFSYTHCPHVFSFCPLVFACQLSSFWHRRCMDERKVNNGDMCWTLKG